MIYSVHTPFIHCTSQPPALYWVCTVHYTSQPPVLYWVCTVHCTSQPPVLYWVCINKINKYK